MSLLKTPNPPVLYSCLSSKNILNYFNIFIILSCAVQPGKLTNLHFFSSSGLLRFSLTANRYRKIFPASEVILLLAVRTFSSYRMLLYVVQIGCNFNNGPPLSITPQTGCFETGSASHLILEQETCWLLKPSGQSCLFAYFWTVGGLVLQCLSSRKEVGGRDIAFPLHQFPKTEINIKEISTAHKRCWSTANELKSLLEAESSWTEKLQ